MKLDRLMLAAPKSGSGKTTITCALLQVFKNRGEQLAAYKCGPDYIDPMFHKKVIEVPSKNLDTFFTDAKTTRAILAADRQEGDLAVLEGVMGLWDGLGGVREEGSSYHLAQVTKTPVILVVDAKGMGRSVIPLIAGFLAYDKEKLIRGVLLNRMSKSYYEIIKPLIESELSIPVVGYFPDYKQFCIASRHLGLVLPDEIPDIQKELSAMAEEVEKTVDVELLLKIAGQAEDLQVESTAAEKTARDVEDKPVIGVAYDEAFCFYYEDNLRLLCKMGAKLVRFSPIHDVQLPQGCCGLLLGGGYPEVYAESLSANQTMRTVLKNAVLSGMPVVAECGGFMYLHSAIVDKNNQSYDMVGVIPDVCKDMAKLVRFGYIELQEKRDNFLEKGTCIKAHEFHYYDSTDNGADCVASKPVSGRNYDCVMTGEHYWMGFPHLYYPSNPTFARNFVSKAEQFRKGKEC